MNQCFGDGFNSSNDMDAKLRFGAIANLDKFFRIPPKLYAENDSKSTESTNRRSIIRSIFLDENLERDWAFIKEYNFDYFQRYDKNLNDYTRKKLNDYNRCGAFGLKTFKELTNYTERINYCVEYFLQKKNPIKEKDEQLEWEVVKTIYVTRDRYVGIMRKKGKSVIHIVKELDRKDGGDVVLQSRMYFPFISRILTLFSMQKMNIIGRVGDPPDRCISIEIHSLGDLENFITAKIRKRFYKPESEFLKYASAQILMALDFLDKIKVAHLDIKPPNICMNTRGYVKLIDFADAKLIKDDDTLIDPVGTVGYSPILVSNDPWGNPEIPYNRSVDIYTFGATFYALATGKRDYRDPKKWDSEHDMRDQLFDRLKLNKDFTQVLKDCLIEQKDELDPHPSKPKRPKPEDIIKHYKFYHDIDWCKLFDQEIDLSEKYGVPGSKFDFKAWFEAVGPNIPSIV